MDKVAVLDYGGGNLRSVVKALEHVAERRHEIVVTADPEIARAAQRLVFPGQGAIGQCMKGLCAAGLDATLRDGLNGKPFLGICLGLQSLLENSEEDDGVETLGLIPGTARRFPIGVRDGRGAVCKVPHIGWNRVQRKRPHPLWRGIENGAHFYFVHSYYADLGAAPEAVASTDYAALSFTSAVARKSIFATQFHPEKSQRSGLRLLANFLSWDGKCEE